MELRLAWRRLSREVLRRPLPHGVLHPRYLLPGQSKQVRIHRLLWWRGRRLPGVLWVGLELALWLRWALWRGWRPLWKTVCRLGPEVVAREGIPIWLQGVRLARIALLGGIPVAALYPFRLYRDDGASRMWDYVYDTETVAFHRWESVPLGLSAKSLALIQDKTALAEEATHLGVETAATLAVLPRGSRIDLTPWCDHPGGIFVKLRSGNRAEDAFAVGSDGVIHCLDGRVLQGAALSDHLQAMAAKDDLLVQPLLTSHPELQMACNCEDVATARLVTRHGEGGFEVLFATAELAVDRRGAGEPRYVLLPLDGEGRMGRFPADIPLQVEGRARIEQVEAALAGRLLPGWEPMREESLKLHEQLLPDMATIAWDWAITPQGGKLLEGNFGWGMQPPQMMHGGLLRDDVDARP